jgi:RNA polymerase sigma-70 factor (ECF subfamily)
VKSINQMLLEIQRGSKASFKHLYDQTRFAVFASIIPYLHDQQLAEDVMQDTYLKAFEKIGTYQPNTNGMNWLFTIAKHTAFDLLKHRKHESQVDREYLEETIAGGYDRYDLASPIIQAAKKVLDKDEQTILFLYALGEYKHREIAGILNIPIGTVLWRYQNAITKMKEVLKP